MSSSTMIMPGSTSCRSRSGSRSPSPFLAPPQADRPLVKRHHTLHTVRPAPYPSTSTSSAQTRSGPSSPVLTPESMSSVPLRRPGAPRRAHSFCGDASTSTYALASASAAAHLSANKLTLVAPPLERSLSSMGGRMTPGGVATVKRPGLSPLSSPCIDMADTLGNHARPGLTSLALAPVSPSLGQSPPAVPQITISPSISPPRPSLAPIQPSAYAGRATEPQSPSASRSSTYIATPTTPSMHGPPAPLFAGAFLEEPLGVGKENLDPRLELGADAPLEVEEVVQGVSGMVVAESAA